MRPLTTRVPLDAPSRREPEPPRRSVYVAWSAVAAGVAVVAGVLLWTSAPPSKSDRANPSARASLEQALRELDGKASTLSKTDLDDRIHSMDAQLATLPEPEAAAIRARLEKLRANRDALHTGPALAEKKSAPPARPEETSADPKQLAEAKREQARQNALVVQSIAAAHSWLLSAQEADGHFDCRKHGGIEGQNAATTSLAVLAFLGAGHTSKTGMYKGTVAKGIDWLSTHDAPADVTQASLRALVLCENYGMAQANQASAESAVKDLLARQGGGGGWLEAGPNDGRGNSIDPTVWAVMALKSAKVCGLLKQPGIGDDDPLQRAVQFLDAKEAEAVAKTNKAEVAAGLGIARIFSGYKVDDATVRRLAGAAAQKLPAWNNEGLGDESVSWYHATLLTFSKGGAEWQRWNAALKDSLLTHQSKEAANTGSWDYREGSAPFRWGRIGTTTLSTLSLEVYYRYQTIVPQPQGPVGIGKTEPSTEPKTKEPDF